MTTWGSVNAEGMYGIATRLAGFDQKELMMEIAQTSRGEKVNLTSVLNAMQRLVERDMTPEEKDEREMAVARFLAQPK